MMPDPYSRAAGSVKDQEEDSSKDDAQLGDLEEASFLKKLRSVHNA